MAYSMPLPHGATVPILEKEQQAAVQRRKFLDIVDACEERLLWAARRLHRGNEDAAQELVQESIVKAYEAFLRGQYDERNQSLSWLLRIQTNLFVTEFRRTRKWNAGITVEDLTLNGETGPSVTHNALQDQPETVLMADTLDEVIHEAMNELTEETRWAVLLVDVDGFTYQEAAETLQIKKSVLKSRLYRGRLSLHNLLRSHALKSGWL